MPDPSSRPGGASPGERPLGDRVRIRALGRDLDAARIELAPLYDGVDWRADTTESDFTFRYTAAGDSGMSLRTSAIQGRLTGQIPPGDELVVQWISHGRAVVDDGHDAQQVRPGVPLLFPAHEQFTFTYEDYDQRIVHLSKERVAEVAAEQGHLGGAAGLRFDHTAPVTQEAVAAWRATVAEVSSALGAGQVSRVLWAELTRRTSLAFLGLYQPQGARLPPELLHPRNATLRQAVEFVHAHAHLPLTVVDIAASANLGVRAVQQMFQTALDRTPMGYLREVRLERVRDELLVSDVDATTVAVVARAWGFSHAGRFSATYAERFGEYPSDTLRRGH